MLEGLGVRLEARNGITAGNGVQPSRPSEMAHETPAGGGGLVADQRQPEAGFLQARQAAWHAGIGSGGHREMPPVVPRAPRNGFIEGNAVFLERSPHEDPEAVANVAGHGGDR